MLILHSSLEHDFETVKNENRLLLSFQIHVQERGELYISQITH